MMMMVMMMMMMMGPRCDSLASLGNSNMYIVSLRAFVESL